MYDGGNADWASLAIGMGGMRSGIVVWIWWTESEAETNPQAISMATRA